MTAVRNQTLRTNRRHFYLLRLDCGAQVPMQQFPELRPNIGDGIWCNTHVTAHRVDSVTDRGETGEE